MEENVLSALLEKALQQAGGVSYLVTQATENPKDFLGLLKAVCGKETKCTSAENVFISIRGDLDTAPLNESNRKVKNEKS